MNHKEGIVFDIQRFSIHDGPGIRTSVFLKGCMMRCIWCHNPESFRVKIQLSYEKSLCTGCQVCQSKCQQEVHSFQNGKHQVHFDRCTNCGACVESCMSGSLKQFGTSMTADEVIVEICKDRAYYAESGGGVTFTGGEPTVQFDFLMELLQKCRQEGISICLETNGVIDRENLLELANYVDLFLVDYKATGKKHKILTGIEEKEVLATLELLNQLRKSVILRCPMIQGINDEEEHFAAIRRLQDAYPNICKTEIMAYHNVGRQKWEAIGEEYCLNQLESAGTEQKRIWESRL